MVVTYETIRRWSQKFGQTYANALRRRRPPPGDQWHLAAVFIAITGEQHYLWRAVDQDGNVLDILVQRRRATRAAVKFLRKLLKGLAFVPRVLSTDKLASYSAAKRDGPPRVAQRQHKRRNNRAANAQQPTRAGATVHIAGPCPTLPGRLWSQRRALPPAPPAKRAKHASPAGEPSPAWPRPRDPPPVLGQARPQARSALHRSLKLTMPSCRQYRTLATPDPKLTVDLIRLHGQVTIRRRLFGDAPPRIRAGCDSREWSAVAAGCTTPR